MNDGIILNTAYPQFTASVSQSVCRSMGVDGFLICTLFHFVFFVVTDETIIYHATIYALHLGLRGSGWMISNGIPAHCCEKPGGVNRRRSNENELTASRRFLPRYNVVQRCSARCQELEPKDDFSIFRPREVWHTCFTTSREPQKEDTF